MAAAHITGTRKENQRNFSSVTLAVSTDVLIDIEKKLSEGKSKSYEHRAEIQLHLAAKRAFEEYKPKRIPKLKDLNTRLAELSDRQKSQYEVYRESRKSLERWQAVQQSINSSLKKLEKEKHHGVSR